MQHVGKGLQVATPKEITEVEKGMNSGFYKALA